MATENECGRQIFVDAGRKGGSSRKRKNRVRERNRIILDEARSMLKNGSAREDLVYYFYKKHESDPEYPRTKRQFRNILMHLETD